MGVGRCDVGPFMSPYSLDSKEEREKGSMRYTEKLASEKPPKEKKEKPIPKAGSKDYDYSNLGKKGVFLGGNGWS